MVAQSDGMWVTVTQDATYSCIFYFHESRHSETFSTVRYDPPPPSARVQTWQDDPPPLKIKCMPPLPMARWVRESVRRRM